MLAIRLTRHGAKKKPFYRVVVTDQRSPHCILLSHTGKAAIARGDIDMAGQEGIPWLRDRDRQVAHARNLLRIIGRKGLRQMLRDQQRNKWLAPESSQKLGERMDAARGRSDCNTLRTKISRKRPELDPSLRLSPHAT